MKKVVLGFSGGVDSAVCSVLLRKQGYEVAGVYLDNSGKAELEAAVSGAEAAGIPLEVIDVKADLEEHVCRPFAESYLRGETPNPCILCNPTVKFRYLLSAADALGAEYIATGHYANIVCEGGRFFIEQGKDTLKDQSYFLWKLDQNILCRTLFPIGGMTKQQVREYLADNNVEIRPSNRESMEICFIENDYRSYLRGRIPDIDDKIGPGKFVDSNGLVVGQHKGYPFYTVGQRKGLEVAFGSPRYVLRTNPEKNTVMLGLPGQLDAEYMLVRNLRMYVNGAEVREPLDARIRYRGKSLKCMISGPVADNLTLVRFLETASAVTPGQSVVFYLGTRVAGGGEIASQRGINQYIVKNEGTDTI